MARSLPSAQPIYDPALFFETLELTRDCGIPLLPGVMPLVSERNAEYLHNEVPGISVPDAIRRPYEGAGKRGRCAGGTGDCQGVHPGNL